MVGYDKDYMIEVSDKDYMIEVSDKDYMIEALMRGGLTIEDSDKDYVMNKKIQIYTLE